MKVGTIWKRTIAGHKKLIHATDSQWKIVVIERLDKICF